MSIQQTCRGILLHGANQGLSTWVVLLNTPNSHMKKQNTLQKSQTRNGDIKRNKPLIMNVNRWKVMSASRVSTGTAVALIVKMNIDGVAEFSTKFLCFLLRESTPGDDWDRC